MERTGFIYSKIKDIYRARTMARNFGGRVAVAGGHIGMIVQFHFYCWPQPTHILNTPGTADFLDLEERLWWQVHSYFRNTATLHRLTSYPNKLTVEVGELKRAAGGLRNPATLCIAYTSTIGELIQLAVCSLDLDARHGYVSAKSSCRLLA